MMAYVCNGYYEITRRPAREGSNILCYWWRVSNGGDWQKSIWVPNDIEKMLKNRLRPFSEWHEDYGEVLCYRWPIEESPMVTSPISSDWLVCGTDGEPWFGTTRDAVSASILDRDGEVFDYFTHWLPQPDSRDFWIDEEKS